MRIPWSALRPFIKAGAVFRDAKYLFPDGGSKPKWFVILSDKIIENIDVTPRTIERNIKKLQEAGLLKRIGSEKGGYWEIL